MYENFILKQTEAGDLTGYHWPCEEPALCVLIIHGIGEYAGRYERIAQALHGRGAAVLSMDLRGHGRSGGKRGHCAPREAVLGDVTSLMEHARQTYPGVPLLLYGHSMGGNIGLDYRDRGELAALPVGYIISAPWVRLVRSVPGLVVKLAAAASRLLPSVTISAGVDQSVLGAPEQVAKDTDPDLIHNRISLATAVDGFLIGEALEKGTDPAKGARGITGAQGEDRQDGSQRPLLLMHGDADRICDVKGSRTLATRLQQEGVPITYIEWPGLYHEIHNGGPASSGEEVIETAAAWAMALVSS